MFHCNSRHPRFLVILLAFFAMFVGGCHVDGTVEFQADGKTTMTLTLEDSRDNMRAIDQTCEGLKLSVEARLTFIKNPKVEDITTPGGHLKCKLTSNEPFGGKVHFNKTKNKYTFVYPGSNSESNFKLSKTKITIVMPGKVIKTTIGEIKGNKVIVNSLNFLSHGVSIEARNDGAAEGSTAAGSSKGTSGTVDAGSSSSHGESGFPWWGWAGIGAGLIAAVGGAAIVAGRRKRKATATGYPPNAMTAGQYPGRHVPTPNMPGPDMSGTYGTLHSPSHNGYGQQTAPTSDPHAAPPAGKQPGDPHNQFRPR